MLPDETITLRDKTVVRLRSLTAADQAQILALFYRLSPQSVYYRALEVRTSLTADEARQLCDVDGLNRVAIAAALAGPAGEAIIGVARYGLPDPGRRDTAEAAVVVEDAYQRRGLGTALLERLAAVARANGVGRFRAAVHTTNAQILRFIDRSGLHVERVLSQGVWEMVIHLPADPPAPAKP